MFGKATPSCSEGIPDDELELGTRVAYALDDEACGFGPLFDLIVDTLMIRIVERS
jgi:hypothetical protein